VNPYALTVQNLTVSNGRHGQAAAVVDGVSFRLRDGEVLAIVGESGCGKTKTAEAIMGLLSRDQWTVRADAIELGDSNLFSLPESGMRKLRGRAISMIFQEPLTALDPVFTVGNQLSSIFRRHRGKTRREASQLSAEMLGSVGFADTGHIMQSYPHQLSGGMRQRVVTAMAMACRPRVLIADEPTTALDVTTQAQVLDQLTRVAQEYGTAILLITHDLGVVAQYCDRALVMLGGRVVEEASVPVLFAGPRHAYTRDLLRSVPAAGPG
jgi:peptide/nickel transport system ATP-binding protein/oligopeptide transport system ATP-binding protein